MEGLFFSAFKGDNPFEGRQRVVANGRKPGGCFATNAGQAMSQKQLLSGSSGFLSSQEFGLDEAGTDSRNFPANALPVWETLSGIQAPHGGAEEAQAKYAALMSVHIASSLEHGFFTSAALGAEVRQQFLRSQILRGRSHPVEDRKPWGYGVDAGVEGAQIHVPMRTGVEAIHQPGLGSEFHFLQQRLPGKCANGVRLMAIPDGTTKRRRDVLYGPKARSKHE